MINDHLIMANHINYGDHDQTIFEFRSEKVPLTFWAKHVRTKGCKMPEKKQRCPIYVLNLGFVVSKEKEGCLSQDFVTELKL